jgi:hypothetical protein
LTNHPDNQLTHINSTGILQAIEIITEILKLFLQNSLAPQLSAHVCVSPALITGLFGPEHELCGVQSSLWIFAIEGGQYSDLSFIEGSLQGFGSSCAPDWFDVDQLLCGGDWLACLQGVALPGVIGRELIEPEGDHAAAHGCG